jgi:putative flippase GtrA
VSAIAAGSRLQLAQHFLREIRSPRWGIAGQAVRFALSGGTVAVVYVTVTTVLHDLLAVPFQTALAIGFVVSVALNFTLQRVFVWRHFDGFALAARHQAVRYLCMSAGQYGLTVLFTSRLPSLLGAPVEVVYLATMIALAATNFLVLRHRVFHTEPPSSRETPRGRH